MALITMAVQSICLNARESIHAGGKLTISTENVEIKKGHDSNALSLNPGKYVQIDIRDTGIGMSEETILNCFDPFYSTKGLGYGLGLSSAYGIVSSHGGQIVAHSKTGKGTVMSIYLPSVSGAPGKSTSQPARKRKRTILVADDEAAIVGVISYKLSDAGLDVIPASDGREALSLAKSELPDLMIIDFHMPGLSGLEVCLQLQADPATAHIRTIMLTACGMDIDQDDFERARVALLMTKPFSPRELVSNVRDLLNAPCPSPTSI